MQTMKISLSQKHAKAYGSKQNRYTGIREKTYINCGEWCCFQTANKLISYKLFVCVYVCEAMALHERWTRIFRAERVWFSEVKTNGSRVLSWWVVRMYVLKWWKRLREREREREEATNNGNQLHQPSQKRRKESTRNGNGEVHPSVSPFLSFSDRCYIVSFCLRRKGRCSSKKARKHTYTRTER